MRLEDHGDLVVIDDLKAAARLIGDCDGCGFTVKLAV